MTSNNLLSIWQSLPARERDAVTARWVMGWEWLAWSNEVPNRPETLTSEPSRGRRLYPPGKLQALHKSGVTHVYLADGTERPDKNENIPRYTDPASGAMWEVWQAVRTRIEPCNLWDIAADVLNCNWREWESAFFWKAPNPADTLCLCAAVACGWKGEQP